MNWNGRTIALLVVALAALGLGGAAMRQVAARTSSARTSPAASTGPARHHVVAGTAHAGDGRDWAHPLAELPRHLVRGDTYYLGPGDYGAHRFDDPPQGDAVITVRRATVADHGSAAGWSDGLAGGPARFTNWVVSSDRYVFDGGRRDADWRLGRTQDYGLRVAGNNPLRLDDGEGHGAHHVLFRFVDVQGGGRDTGSGDDVVYAVTGNVDITFDACALHDSDRTIFLMRGPWRHLVVRQSYLARNTSTDAVHGELMSVTEATDVTFEDDVMEDIEGTAFFAAVNGGTLADWHLVGNLVQHTDAYSEHDGRPKHTWGVSGFVFVGKGGGKEEPARAEHMEVRDNVFRELKGLWSGVVIETGSDNVVRGNAWWRSVRTNNNLGERPVIADNWYFETPADGDDSPSKTVCQGACDIFVDAAHGDFRRRPGFARTDGAPPPIAPTRSSARAR